ncbi:hypothetical protein [Actinoallomurus sp. CA-142502]|uniref:hypothetical protein n=1 Tax=Actinoallomurus sp. CA-142502 TaxID=3239885 RepID=UPI003D9402DF
MHAKTDPIADVRRQVAARLHELETALTAHGFTVTAVDVMFWSLEVRAAASVAAPACTRRVQLAPDPSGELALSWHLVLPGAADGIPETELIGAENDIGGAVERIAQALTRGGQR